MIQAGWDEGNINHHKNGTKQTNRKEENQKLLLLEFVTLSRTYPAPSNFAVDSCFLYDLNVTKLASIDLNYFHLTKNSNCLLI
jgi:hypothetical protein